MRIAVVGSGGTGGYFGGLLARAGEEVTFNASLRLIEASRGALVLATIPLWSALLARIARSERLVPRQIGGVFLSLGGVGLALAERGLGWQGGLGTLSGDGLMLVTALCGAVYAVLAPLALARYDALTVTTYAMVLGTLLPKASLRATFSEKMRASSINGKTFKLFKKKGSTKKLSARVTYNAATKKATLNPTTSLRRGLTYKAVVTTGAKDVAGNRLDQKRTTKGLQQKVWVFTVRR